MKHKMYLIMTPCLRDTKADFVFDIHDRQLNIMKFAKQL